MFEQEGEFVLELLVATGPEVAEVLVQEGQELVGLAAELVRGPPLRAA
jgi:hypothetical protein